MAIPNAPKGVKASGRRLWRAVLASYVLSEHETSLLVQACRVADVCEDLQLFLDQNGPMISGSSGRIRPAVAELRQQRITLARLIVALRVPLGDQEEAGSKSGSPRVQRRGVRGFYALPGARVS